MRDCDDDYWTRGYVDPNRSESTGSSLSDEESRDLQERKDAEFGLVDRD
jgi:hypothetical protein